MIEKQIAAEPFKWFKYTGKMFKVKNAMKQEGRGVDQYELDFKKGYVQGLAPSLVSKAKYGEYTFVDIEAPHEPFYISKDDADKIILNSVKFHPNHKVHLSDAQINKGKDDPALYHWHTFTGLKGAPVLQKGKTAKIGMIRPDDIFGVLMYADNTKGGYILPSSNIDDKNLGVDAIRVDGDHLAKLLVRSTPLDELPKEFQPKEVSTPKQNIKPKPVSKPIVTDAMITSEKDNLDIYEWYLYTGSRGTSIYPKGGVNKAGIIKSNDKFGLLRFPDATKGAYFVPDAAVSDTGFKRKPITIDGYILASLLGKSDRLDTRPEASRAPEDKVIPEPTIEPKNGIPSVKDLKVFHEKIASINHDLKQIASLPIRTLSDYQLAASKMENIREKDYEAVKSLMHSIGMPKSMADIFITAIAANYHSSVAIIKAKKRAAKNGQIADDASDDEVIPVETDSVDDTDDSTVLLTPAQLKVSLLKAITSKGRDITVAESVPEIEAVLQQLKELYGTSRSQIQKSLPGIKNKAKVKAYLAELKGAYDKAKSVIEAKLNRFKQSEELPVDEWDDEVAETPSDDFTPIDDENETFDEDKVASPESMDELGSLLEGNEPEPTVGAVEQSIIDSIEGIDDRISRRLNKVKTLDDLDNVRNLLAKLEEDTNSTIVTTYKKSDSKRQKYLDDLDAAVELANESIDAKLKSIEKPKPKNVEDKPTDSGQKDTITPQFDEDRVASDKDMSELADLLGGDDEPTSDKPVDIDEHTDEEDENGGFTSGFEVDDFDDFGFPTDLGAAGMVKDED